MAQKFYKHKLLLDEGFYYKKDLPLTKSRFDVKHIAGDYKQKALPDLKVYELAKEEGRILVTLNIKHFKPLVSMSKLTDKKLTALLNKSSKKSLLGKLTTISGEGEK